MWLVLFLSALGIAVVALLILSFFKGALAQTWKELDDAKAAAARALQADSTRGTAQPIADSLQHPKAPRQEESERVLAASGAPSPHRNTERSPGIEGAVQPIVSGETNRKNIERKGLWVDSHYCWVVLCKNHWFHLRQNLFFRHRIPLAETDPLAPRPSLTGRFKVRCDECGREYVYNPSEVLRFEQELPEAFTPHPLFGDR
jgi:hypothetical protein